MAHAILVAGNARRFVDSVQIFRMYLIDEQLITRKKAKIFETAYIAEGMFEYRISSAIAAKTKEPLLLLFSGHGGKFGWSLDDARTFSYFKLAKMLLVGRRPVTILNDCCHAMALTEQFDSNAVLPTRLSLIAATESGETTSGGLTEIALNSWKQRRPVRFGPELRWGAKFDHHYYGRINTGQ